MEEIGGSGWAKLKVTPSLWLGSWQTMEPLGKTRHSTRLEEEAGFSCRGCEFEACGQLVSSRLALYWSGAPQRM